MLHGDNKGLVLPPTVAPIQVVIVPIITKEQGGENQTSLCNKARELCESLKEGGVRVKVDDRNQYSPGWRYNHWELKGVPIRLELGPNDMRNRTAVLARRDTGTKVTVSWERLKEVVASTLVTIHSNLITKATKERDAHLFRATTWTEFMRGLDSKNLVLTPWCKNSKVL